MIAVLDAFGLPITGDLDEARAFFASRQFESHIRDVFKLAGISEVRDDQRPARSGRSARAGKAAPSAIRNSMPCSASTAFSISGSTTGSCAAQGFACRAPMAPARSASEVRRFLRAWCDRMQPVYMAVSLPDTFAFPKTACAAGSSRESVLPVCRERDIPLSVMIGVRYLVNPALNLAGDAVGKADLRAVERLCLRLPRQPFPDQRAEPRKSARTVVYARKFAQPHALRLLVVPE